jgi:hypothetical protein
MYLLSIDKIFSDLQILSLPFSVVAPSSSTQIGRLKVTSYCPCCVVGSIEKACKKSSWFMFCMAGPSGSVFVIYESVFVILEWTILILLVLFPLKIIVPVVAEFEFNTLLLIFTEPVPEIVHVPCRLLTTYNTALILELSTTNLVYRN